MKFISEQHGLMKHKLERLTFDRESSIVAMQEDIEARSINLILKEAGQKVGLAEVSIRTKAEVRATVCMAISRPIYSMLTNVWIRFLSL